MWCSLRGILIMKRIGHRVVFHEINNNGEEDRTQDIIWCSMRNTT